MSNRETDYLLGSKNNEPLEVITRNVTGLVTNISQLTSGIKKLGTPSDTTLLRDSIKIKQNEISSSIRNTSELFKVPGADQDKTKFQKLLSTFQSLNQQFQELSNEYSKKERLYQPLEVSQNGGGGGGGSMNDISQQTSNRRDDWVKLQEVDSTEHDRQLIEERNAGIRQVTEDLTTLHEIFVDVSKMVGEQGQELEQVEETVHQTNITVAQATDELRMAGDYQRAAGRKKIWICLVCLIGLLIIGGVIGLVVWFVLK